MSHQILQPYNHSNLNQKLTNSTIQSYYCGCGVSFHCPSVFKTHVQQMHEDVFIQNSSHMLSQITGKVFSRWNRSKDFMKVETENNQFQGGRGEEIIIMDNKKLQYVKKEYEIYQEETQVEDQTLSEEDEQSHIESQKEENKVDKTKLEKTRKFTIPPTFKQNCLTFIPNTEAKLAIKKQQQDLKKSNNFAISSTFNQTIRSFVPDTTKKGACKKQNEKRDLNTKVNKKKPMFNTSELNIRPSKTPDMLIYTKFNMTIQLPKAIFSVFKHVSELRRHRRRRQVEPVTFECGCGELIEKANLKGRGTSHINREHQGIVPRRSSHIFIRKQKENGRQAFFYLQVDGANDQMGWACSCSQTINRSKIQFIKHVQYIHKGITPTYLFPIFNCLQS